MILASVVLPTPGGPQKMQRTGVVALDLYAQGLAGAENVLLPDELVERARTHAVGQRAGLVDRLAHAAECSERDSKLVHHGGTENTAEFRP